MILRLRKQGLLLCALTLCLGVKAQLWDMTHSVPDVTFRGHIVDSLTLEPLPAAVISVVSRNYSGDKTVRNYVSDDKGAFQFVCRFSPNHRMEVAVLGYKPYMRYLTMDKAEQELGLIRIPQSTQAIDEVVVKARLQMYKMKGDTLLFFPRAVNTMKDDAALEILRQMPGVEVSDDGNVKILGEQVERIYVNEKLLFGENPTVALKELDAKEVASIEAYDEVDEVDAVTKGANARKRKVLNVTTFNEFIQSYSGKARGEMGADFHENAAAERPVRYLASGDVNFFSEAMQIIASGSSSNLTASNSGRVPAAYASQRQSKASADVSGKSGRHGYKARYYYGGGAEQKRSSSASDYFPSDYFTSQHIEQSQLTENESDGHTFAGEYNYIGERSQFATSLKGSFGNYNTFAQSRESTVRDGMALSANDITNSNHIDTHNVDWNTSGGWRFKSGNSVSLSTGVYSFSGISRGLRLERRTTEGVETPLDWESYAPNPEQRVSVRAAYMLDFGKAGSLRLNSNMWYTGGAERLFYTNIQTGEQDLARSEDAFDKTIIWSAWPSYTLRSKDYTFAVSLDYQLEHRVYDDAKAGTLDRRNFHLVNGDISYNYKRPKKNFSLSLSSKSQSIPAKNFSSRIDDSNPLYVSTGNRSLVPSKTYTFIFGGNFIREKISYDLSANFYVETDPTESRRIFFKEATVLPQYDNYLMPAGSTLTTLENGASFLRFSVHASFKARIAPLRLFLEMGCSYTFSNPEEELYGKRERTATHNVEHKTVITTNFSPRFRIKVNNIAGLNFRSSFGNSSREFRDVLTVSVEWDVVKNLYLRGDYTGIFRSISANIPTPNANLLSFSLDYRVLKERGRIAFNAYDVMNDYSPIRVSQSNMRVSRSVEYVSANYFTVSFEYKFNNRRTVK